MDPQQLLGLYRAMVMARQIDKVEQQLTNRGEAFFHVSGAGHEGTVVVASHLHEDDWLHCHYRDKALLIARGTFSTRCSAKRNRTRAAGRCARI